MVGQPQPLATAEPLAITRAILEGALHKANDAVHADHQQDWEYAMQSYADSCALLGRCMERTDQRDEEGALHWKIMEGIRNRYIRRIHEIHNTQYPPTPRSHTHPRSPRSGVNSQRSSTWIKTPPQTARVHTPPRTPKMGVPMQMHPIPAAVEMRDRNVSVWSND